MSPRARMIRETEEFLALELRDTIPCPPMFAEAEEALYIDDVADKLGELYFPQTKVS